MSKGQSRILTCAAIAAMLLTGCTERQIGELEAERWASLPSAAAAALQEAYPETTLWSAEYIDLGTLQLYAVELEQGGQMTDVKVTDDGVIIETQADVTLDVLPEPVARGLTQVAEGATIRKIRKKEKLWGHIEMGTMARLDQPSVVYEAILVKDQVRRNIELAPNGTVLLAAGDQGEIGSLPAVAEAALKKAYPTATIVKVYANLNVKARGIFGSSFLAGNIKGGDLESYKVELELAGREVDVEILSNGVVVEAQTDLRLDDLPRPAADVLAQAAAGATVEKVKKVELGVRIEDGKVIALETPTVLYEARLLKDGKKGEVKLTADGAVLEAKNVNLPSVSGGKEAGRWASLSAPAAAAIKQSFPEATLSSLSTRAGNGLSIYHFELDRRGTKIEGTATTDGVIIESQILDVPLEDLPRPVANVFADAAEGATIEQVKKKERLAQVDSGQVIKREMTRVIYELRLLKDDQRSMIEVAADGTILK